MDRRRFLEVMTVAGATTVLAACDRMPTSAIAPWQGPPAGTADPRMRMLSWAVLAPNSHNLQSWQVDISPADGMLLYADPTRLLPQTDPFGRQILVTLGGFLELLDIAASAEGYRTDIALFPEGVFPADRLDARPVASVKFARDAARAVDPLFAVIPNRRSSKVAYDTARPVPAVVIAAVGKASARPGLSYGATSDAARVREIGALAAEGYRVEFISPAKMQESLDVLRIGAAEIAREPSGITLHGPLAWWGTRLGLLKREAMSDPSSTGFKRQLESRMALMYATPTWIWIDSDDDSRATQVEAGRAYLRLDLAAAAAGVAIHPNSQVLQEFVEMQPLYARFHETVGVTAPRRVQMLARLGYADAVPPTPRRPVERILKA